MKKTDGLIAFNNFSGTLCCKMVWLLSSCANIKEARERMWNLNEAEQV